MVNWGGRVRSKLTYANVMVTLLAFVVLCGGIAWAVEKNSVGPRQIKRNAVRSAEVKNDALTGTDIDEASLGKVPSARDAENAANAANATSAATAADSARLGGKQVAPLAFQAARGTPITQIAGVGPLRIYAACASNGVVNLSLSSSAGGTAKFMVRGPTQSNYSGVALSEAPAEIVSSAALYDRSPGIFTYPTGGRVINGHFMISSSPAAPEPCLVSGLVAG